MKKMFLLCILILSQAAFASDKFNMSFKDEELTKVIETYSKKSGQKFVIDPSVRGKVTILISDPVSKEEAFNHLSTALAVNGFAISTQGDAMVIRSARTLTRANIEVVSELPAIEPERMISWVYTAKHIPAETINREIRMLLSKDGEMGVVTDTNQILFSDWISTLHRVDQILKKIDQPVSAETQKIIQRAQQKNQEKKDKNKSKE